MTSKKKPRDSAAPNVRMKGDDEGGRVEQLERVVSLRLTQTDYELWLSKVEASGQTRSEFFRSCVLGNRTEVIAKKAASTDKLRVIYLVSKASNNLNQLAWSAHQARKRGLLDGRGFDQLNRHLRLISDTLQEKVESVD